MPDEQTSVTTERQLSAGPAKDTGGESEETTRSSQAQAETKETKPGKPAEVTEEPDQFYDPKDFAASADRRNDSKKRVDDKPYGGGPGMVIRALPVVKAI